MSLKEFDNYSNQQLIKMKNDLIKWAKERVEISSPFSIEDINTELASRRFPIDDEQPNWELSHTEQSFI